MKLHCLGTVGFHPTEARHTSCYFLPASGILLDAGTGSFRLAPLIETATLDILLSHAHLDHVFGLTTLLDVLYQRPVERLRIWGEAAKLRAVREHLFSELIFPVPPDAEWMEIDRRAEFSIGNAHVSWQPQSHPGGSVAYRIDWADVDKRLVYATDTRGETEAERVAWFGSPDLLIHECYFRDSAADWAEKTGHTFTSRLAEIARSCQPTKLLVTHINPLEEADDPVDLELLRSTSDAEVVLAEDRLVLDF